MTRTQLLYLLRVVASCVILLAIGRFVGWRDLGAKLANTRVEWVLAMYGAALAAFVAGAAMLHVLLTRVGLRIRLARILLANSLGIFYSLLVPGDILAGVAKWADLSAATGDKPRVLSALVLGKITLALPPLVLGSIALSVRNPLPSAAAPVLAVLVATVLVLGVVLVSDRRFGGILDRFMARALGRLPSALRVRALSVLEAAQAFRTLTFPDRLAALALSTLAFLLGVVAMACAVRAAGASVALYVLMWVAMTLFTARLVPITLSNLGVREGILVAVFGLYGVDASTALLVGLIMFTTTLLLAGIGGVYQLSIASGWVTWRRT